MKNVKGFLCSFHNSNGCYDEYFIKARRSEEIAAALFSVIDSCDKAEHEKLFVVYDDNSVDELILHHKRERQIELRKCTCGTDETPEIYEDGVARRRIYPDEGTYLTESDGYIIECPECGSSTRYYRELKWAIEDWNNKKLV